MWRYEAEGQVDGRSDLLHLPAAQAQGPGVAGVDELGSTVAQADPQQLSGDVAAATVLGHGLVGALRLLGEAGPLPAGAAQCADEEGGQERGVHVVPHGIGDGQLDVVAVYDVVEGVAADMLGRLQGPGDRELGRLAGQRRGQQPVLDLGGQAQREVRRPTDTGR